MTAVQTTYVLPSATEGRLPQMCFFLCRTVTLLKISPLQRYAIQESQRDCYVKFSPQPYLHSVVDRTNSKRVQLVKPHARTHARARTHTHQISPAPPLSPSLSLQLDTCAMVIMRLISDYVCVGYCQLSIHTQFQCPTFRVINFVVYMKCYQKYM